MLPKTTARLVAGLTCLMMIAVPVSAQLGAPGVPAVPGVPGVPGAPGLPATPDLPEAPAVPALPETPAPVTVDQRGNAFTVCADGSDAHALASQHAGDAQGQVEAAAAPALAAADPVTSQLPLMSTQSLPDPSELGLAHCAHADLDDPEGTATGAAGQGQGFLGTLQSWAQKATSWLPF